MADYESVLISIPEYPSTPDIAHLRLAETVARLRRMSERMMHRNLGQRSLAEAWLPERSGANRRLEAVNEVVNRTGVERSLADIHAARTGRPSYPPLLICQEYSEQLRSPLPPSAGEAAKG